jgi:ketosteroid isomerase-like protein
MIPRPRLPRSVVALSLAALLAGCASGKPPAPPRPDQAAAPTAAPAPQGAPASPARPASPGLRPATSRPPSGQVAARPVLGRDLPAVSPAEAEAQARAADLAFSAASAAHDQRAFAALLAADAVFVSRDGVAMGPAAIGIDWGPLLAPGGPTLAWAPDAVRASGVGDLVMTRGAWTLTSAEGGPAGSGRYVTIWRREPDGTLRAALDATDTPLPPESARATRQVLQHLLSGDERFGASAGLLLDGSNQVGGFLLVEVKDRDGWRVLVEVGVWRPAAQ